MFVFDGDPSFRWTVEGEVASFTATLYDDQYAVVHTGAVSGNSLNIGASTLEPGRVYTLEIVAQPASGGEATSSTFAFRVAAPVTEAPTEAPTPAPISAPSIGAAGSGYDGGRRVRLRRPTRPSSGRSRAKWPAMSPPSTPRTAV